MSYVPHAGSIVRLYGNRLAIVSNRGPGGEEMVMFSDGHEEPIDAWQINEVVANEPDTFAHEPADLLLKLQRYARIK